MIYSMHTQYQLDNSLLCYELKINNKNLKNLIQNKSQITTERNIKNMYKLKKHKLMMIFFIDLFIN